MRMIIGIDFRLANKSPRGMARYCREIVRELLNLDKENKYILYVDTKPAIAFEGTNYNYSIIETENFVIGEQICLPLHIRKDNCDVFWSPYNTFPISIPKRTKLLVSIHDVIFLYKLSKEQSLYQKIGALYRRYILKYFYKKINGCFTVSNFSRLELLKHIHFDIPVEITYNCISGFDLKVKKWLENNPGLKTEDYFFTLSGDAPSKNLSTVIDVFESELVDQTIIIGGVAQNSPIRRRSSDHILFLDEGISDEDLIQVYLQCKCFLFCSKYEGFGIPIIEAAICSKPIIASNSTSIPEILDGKGLLVEPSFDGIKSGIVRYINNRDIVNTDYKGMINKFSNWRNPAKIILQYVQES